MQLSKNFYLYEFEKSQTAKRHGIDNSIPDGRIRENIQAVVDEILQPLRSHIGIVINVNSGYRSLPLNRALGSRDTSQHVQGEAADIEAFGMSNPKLAQTIVDLGLPFDQLILEFHDPEDGPNDGWVHVSHKRNGHNRGEILTINRSGVHLGLVGI